MSTNSSTQGRAYEYAWINALYDALSEILDTKIIYNSSLEVNKSAWLSMDSERQKLFKISAQAAVDTILELEPLMTERQADDVLFLECKSDRAGREGDVRDIVVKKSGSPWEIGLSIKHNHEAIKHSRLSSKLDFGESWFNKPCSKEYWRDVKPVFDRLVTEKERGTKWGEIADKDKSIYAPLLQAFIDEIWRSYKEDKDIPRKMIEYLIGTDDYYKIISHDNKCLTIIRTFNVHGTLNKPGRIKVSAITVPLIQLPTEFVAIKFKTGTKSTIEMYLNNGWQLSFRIHNAEKKVIPSLKFDIQFIGMPVSILNIECKWKVPATR